MPLEMVLLSRTHITGDDVYGATKLALGGAVMQIAPAGQIAVLSDLPARLLTLFPGKRMPDWGGGSLLIEGTGRDFWLWHELSLSLDYQDDAMRVAKSIEAAVGGLLTERR